MNIAFFQRMRGYLETAPAIWAAQRLLQGTPGRSAIALAHAFLRQAVTICPHDPELANLTRALGNQSGITWEHPQISGPKMSEVQPLLDVSGIESIVALLTDNSAPLVRHMALATLWSEGSCKEIFSDHVQTIFENHPDHPSLPLLAWGIHALGADDLATAMVSQAESFLGEALKAHLAWTAGNQATARNHLVNALKREPAQPHLIERLAQLELSSRPLPPADAFRVHILFYTFNKLDTTLATLKSLLESDIGLARITLLNNGSTAFSHEQFASGVDQVAQGREVEVIHLPVNIGAPAARNWLYRLPHVQEADYIVFLDDDVLLPKSWLPMYLQDMADHPEVCAVGPKGLNPNPFRTIQYIYRYFEEVGEHKIRFTNNAPMNLDLGQFDGRRPCLSVMGCCHMFDRRKLERLGVPDFDVRFTPSQVDDLERDIQIWKHGGRVLYDGRVEVVHMQDAGRAAPKTEASWGHVWGNHMKMEFKLTGRELRSIDEQVRAVEEKHWQTCLAEAWDLLPDKCRKFWAEQNAQ
jgi:GT2 family glycosyltransferase